MFGRIRNWLRNRERRKALFSFYDGTRQRAIDPIKASIAMEMHPTFNAERHVKAYDHGDNEAALIICQMVRDVFDVKEWNEKSGLTMIETIAIYQQWIDYCEALKKSTEHSPKLPERTVESISTNSNEAITSDTSACGSIPIESDSVETIS
jgi:ATP/ADP translocase